MPIDRAKLQETIRRICQPGRGILAADESSGTIKKRLDSIKTENTEENRRTYRNMLFLSPGIERNISGVILYDETVDQKDDAGMIFPVLLESLGIVPGIKVDEGKDEHPRFSPQTLTKGLDALAERLNEYSKRSSGALRFTKWRQVILVEPNPPQEFLDECMEVMAKYAKICQEGGYVPITEPEVLMDGTHTLKACAKVTERTLKTLYVKLREHNVDPALTLLKPNMILSGKELKRDSAEEVAKATVDVFSRCVPKEVPGIVFLSGGQTPEQATENLNAIALYARSVSAPWWMSYSYGRALQDHALKAWAGSHANLLLGQRAFLWRAKLNGAAQTGKYTTAMEKEAAAAAA